MFKTRRERNSFYPEIDGSFVCLVGDFYMLSEVRNMIGDIRLINDMTCSKLSKVQKGSTGYD